jgi:hypothetical protein
LLIGAFLVTLLSQNQCVYFETVLSCLKFICYTAFCFLILVIWFNSCLDLLGCWAWEFSWEFRSTPFKIWPN